MFTAGKLIPSVVVLAALLAGTTARPPSAPVAPTELFRLVFAVAALYLVGGVAVLEHRDNLAAMVFGVGLALCGFALWLSRGSAPPPRDDDGGLPVPEGPPRPPEFNPSLPPVEPSPPSFDWAFYEDQLREPVPR